MAKISDLSPVDPETIDGSETVPVVKDGATGRSTMTALLQPSLAAAAQEADRAEAVVSERFGTVDALNGGVAFTDPDGKVAAYFDTTGKFVAPGGIDAASIVDGPGSELVRFSAVAANDAIAIAYIDRSGKVSRYVTAWGASVDLVGPLAALAGNVTVAANDLAVPDQVGVTANHMWSWWVHPFVEDHKGTVFLGSVGQARFGPLGPVQVYEADYRNAVRAEIGTVEASTKGTVDDHNAPSISLNPSPNAQYPLLVFQADHNKAPYVRFWRSRTGEANDLSGPMNIPFAERLVLPAIRAEA